MANFTLNGTTLRVVVNHVPPYCIILRQNEEIIPQYSIELELLKLLEHKFNFKSHLIDGNQSWGMLKNGKWNGAIGMLINRTVDLGTCSMSFSSQRSKVLDFSHFTAVDEMTFVSQLPGLASRVWILLEPFSWLLWIANFISYFAVIGTLYLLYRFYLKGYQNSSGRTSFRFIAMKVFSVLVNQSSNFAWREVSSIRLVYSTWMLAVLVLTTTYSGSFYSRLALFTREPPIDTLSEVVELVSQDSHRIVIYGESGVYRSFFVHSTPDIESAYLIGQHMNRTRRQIFNKLTDVINLIESDPRMVFVESRSSVTYLSMAYSHRPLHIGSEAITQDYLALAFPKNSPLREPFNSVIKKISKQGLFAHWTQRVYNKAAFQNARALIRNKSANDRKVAPLTLKDFYSIFILWSLGTLIGCIFFLGEMCAKFKC